MPPSSNFIESHPLQISIFESHPIQISFSESHPERVVKWNLHCRDHSKEIASADLTHSQSSINIMLRTIYNYLLEETGWDLKQMSVYIHDPVATGNC